MWRDKLEWDESLPQSLDTAWSTFCAEFADVQYSSFPRYVLKPGAAVEIHSFCDASLEAYGAAIYTRSIKDGNVQTHLLCSKARVAPLKTLTVPKLELCAAALLAQLVGELKKIKLLTVVFIVGQTRQSCFHGSKKNRPNSTYSWPTVSALYSS